MKLLRAWSSLAFVSFRRLLWSVNTLMVAFPLVAVALFILRRRERLAMILNEEGMERAFELFSERFVLVLFTSFLLPICALAYGTTSLGGDREDRTLLFLLVRPIPRALILLAKWSAALPLTLTLVAGSFYVYCALYGEVGQAAFDAYLAPVVWMTLAYLGLFHLFSVLFRHSTIVALVYSLFIEFFLGNMPGIVQQVAVSYYGKSMIFERGLPLGLPPPEAAVFQPVSAAAAEWTLIAVAVGSLLAGCVIFQVREYRDLS